MRSTYSSPPEGRAVRRVRVVRVPVGVAADEDVVVVRHALAARLLVWAVPVVAVLQVQRYRAAWPVGQVGPAAVVRPAVVEVHVALRNLDRDPVHLGAVVA